MNKIKKALIIVLAVGIFGAIFIGLFYSRTLIQAPKELINLEAIEKEVEEIRGLNFKNPIEHKTMEREELQPFLLKTEFNESNVEDILKTERLLIALHLWNESESFKDSLLEAYTEGVAGFYDTDTKAFYEIFGGDEPPAWRKAICAHELTHALQDQNFPEVFELMEANETSGDEILALQCLIEGDATFIQQAYMMGKLTKEEMSELWNYSLGITEEIKIDPLIEKIMIFPYLEGTKFIFDLYMKGDIQEINKAFENLPATTEQIMHPEKYFKGEKGSEVSLPNLANNQNNWTKIEEDILGEAMIYLTLINYLSEQEARSSAEGWGGDRYTYYESEGNYLLIAKQNWDSRKDAFEFYNSWYNFTKAWSANQSLKPISTFLLQLNLPFQPYPHRSLKIGDTYIFLKMLRDETVIIETQDLNILKRVTRKI
jgi:hypothetical protein